MQRKRVHTGAAAALGMMILILDGKTAISGARAGLELALTTVVPSLFPFFFLSLLLTGSLVGVKSPLLRPIGRLFGVPDGAESLLICGFLGGYPAGAQSIAAAYEAGSMTREDGERMLAFCNNAGPSFLFGMVASMFDGIWIVWALWGIHITGALFAAQFFRCKAPSVSLQIGNGICVTQALKRAIGIMAGVCGWVILFRMVTAFLQRWLLWLLPVTGQSAVIGILELSNGICSLPAISDWKLRFLLCSVMLAFGGLCVTMQTASVTKGLSLRRYFMGKGLQTAFSYGLCCVLLYGTLVPILVISAISLVFAQKSSRNRAAVGV